MYASFNPKTKKELKEMIKKQVVKCHQPGPFGPNVKDGDHCCEGPHYPKPHKWYARVRVKNGYIIKVIS